MQRSSRKRGSSALTRLDKCSLIIRHRLSRDDNRRSPTSTRAGLGSRRHAPRGARASVLSVGMSGADTSPGIGGFFGGSSPWLGSPERPPRRDAHSRDDSGSFDGDAGSAPFPAPMGIPLFAVDKTLAVQPRSKPGGERSRHRRRDSGDSGAVEGAASPSVSVSSPASSGVLATTRTSPRRRRARAAASSSPPRARPPRPHARGIRPPPRAFHAAARTARRRARSITCFSARRRSTRKAASPNRRPPPRSERSRGTTASAPESPRWSSPRALFTSASCAAPRAAACTSSPPPRFWTRTKPPEAKAKAKAKAKAPPPRANASPTRTSPP